MESSTKTYLVGKGAKTLVGNNVPQNSLDISKSATKIYHIVPSCAYIINNTDGTAAPQEFSFFLFKKENDTILDVTKQTEFLIQYTVGETNGEFKMVSNKLKETEFPYKLSEVTSFVVQAKHNNIIAATFNIACVSEKSGTVVPGADGKDGITVYAIPGFVSFQSNEDGIVDLSNNEDKKEVQIIAYRGKDPVTPKIGERIAATHCEVEKITGTENKFRFKSIARHSIDITIPDSGATITKEISYTSGQVDVPVLVDGIQCNLTVPFSVDNTVLYTSFYTRTDRELKDVHTKYEETQDYVKNTWSEIKKTADEIDASVGQIKTDSETMKKNYSEIVLKTDGITQTVEQKISDLDNTYDQYQKDFSTFKQDPFGFVFKTVTDTGKEQFNSVFSQTSTGIEFNTMKGALNTIGIEINGETSNINIKADSINTAVKEIVSTGDFTAKSLNTLGGEKDPVIKIEGGLLTAYSENNRITAGKKANLVFGLNNNKDKKFQFEYYDDEGRLLWALGPMGLIQYITSGQLQRKKSFWVFDLKSGHIGDNGKLQEGASVSGDNFYFVDIKGTIGNEIKDPDPNAEPKTCFQYVAPTFQGQITADLQFNLTKEQAKKYNYCWFYSCSEDYTENNLFEWDLSKNNIELGQDKKAEWKVMILGSDYIFNELATGLVVVEKGEKWTSVTPITRIIDLKKFSVNIGSKQILTFNRKPTGQDDCFIPVGETNNSIVYSNNVTSTTIASQTI